MDMEIKGAVSLDKEKITQDREPNHVLVTYAKEGGNIVGLKWRFGSDDGLYGMIKRRGGIWNGSMWLSSTASVLEEMLEAIRKRNPAWPVLHRQGDETLQDDLAGIGVFVMKLDGDHRACLFQHPLPYFTDLSALYSAKTIHCAKVSGSPNSGTKTLLIGCASEIDSVVAELKAQGAVEDKAVAFRLTSVASLNVSVNGWAVKVACDLANPLHYLIMPRSGKNRLGKEVPWSGSLNTTRSNWPKFKERLQTLGLTYEGADPDEEVAVRIKFDSALVPGWDFPASNGYRLHEYQKTAVEFCASRGMRALIGDEMGIGKTAQAIAAAEATGLTRILVACPSNARYVWDREIKGWSSGGLIQHITGQLDKLDLGARWHIVSYDLIAARTETWRLENEQEKDAFLAAFPLRCDDVPQTPYPRKIAINAFSEITPAFANPKRSDAWQLKMRRLKGELVEQLLAAHLQLAIIDEAHRVKNADAKRTKALQRITAGGLKTLLLTGTPLRNNEEEAKVLLSFLDRGAGVALGSRQGYLLSDIKDYLRYYMIRRTKEEVLPELPEKTRQRIDIGALDEDSLISYFEALDRARQKYSTARERGDSKARARQTMMGSIEQSRVALGLAKVRGNEVADLVANVVDNKGCAVVFCAHRQVSSELQAQLLGLGFSAAVLDSRTPQTRRASMVDEFQAGSLQVLIGGINCAGEAITLTRADTVIFVELDWVPGALMQAEDRIHREGQKRNCQVIQLIARLKGKNLDEMMISILGSKMSVIGHVLGETTDNIVSAKVSAERSIRTEAVAKLLLEFEDAVKDDDAQKQSPLPARTEDESEAPLPAKTKRGRPRVYIDQLPASSTERSKLSVQKLQSAGGKRVMVRLTPQGREALKVIMAFTGQTEETETINVALIARSHELTRAATLTG